MEDPNNLSSTAVAAASDTASLVPDANGSAVAVPPDPAEFGFQRAEFGQEDLAGTIGPYDRHVFLCYKSPQEWPSHIEAAEFDRLPRILAAAVAARKSEMKKKTALTICEGEDSNESSNGDLLIFPDMVRYRRLTHFDVDNFVEEVLVKEAEWLPGAVEPLVGSYVFVCAHGSRDKRCGVCGPPIIEKFREEIQARGLQGLVSVSPCSHIGGHKYAGNVIVYSRHADKVTGHWYGYVSPDDVPALLDQHIGKGEILAHLWRGQMGVSKEEQKKMFERFLLREDVENGGVANGSVNDDRGCCQGEGNFVCCQDMASIEKQEIDDFFEQMSEGSAVKISKETNRESVRVRKFNSVPGWFVNWEREDTYAALAVVAAVASIAVAYGCYKNLK